MPSSSRPFAVFRFPHFAYFLWMRFALTLALQIQGVVVAWQIFEITHDPLSLGLIGLAEALPALVVALFAGHVADNFRRKRIIGAGLLVLSLCSFGLLWMTVQSWPNATHLWGMYISIGISGLARGFVGPAIFALLPQLVQKEYMGNAITWNTNFWQTAAVLGPAVAGFLYGWCGAGITYGIILGLVVLALGWLLFIPNFTVPRKLTNISLLESLKEGIGFVFGNQIILSAISLDLFAVLFGGAVALLPIFSAEILNVGPSGLGLLRAAPSIGAVTMGVLVLYFPIKKGAGKKLLWSVAGFGASIIAFGLSTNFYLSFFCLIVGGMLDAVSVILRTTLIQTFTPDELKGRVSSVNNIFIGSSNEIGAFESGVMAKILGTVPSVVFGGCMTILVVIITALRAKKLTKLDV